jgi:hypothetical protein
VPVCSNRADLLESHRVEQPVDGNRDVTTATGSRQWMLTALRSHCQTMGKSITLIPNES